MKKIRNSAWLANEYTSASEPERNTPISKEIKVEPRRRIRLGWKFWGGLSLLLTTGIGAGAVMLLLKMPSLPNCPSIFMPTASASMRLYCAELAAGKQTVGDLLYAIDLVRNLPTEHPLYGQVNEYIARWSKEILALADENFQQGRLDEAIAVAQRIPRETAAHALVAGQIQQWRKIWQEAEQVYRQAEQALRENNWSQATRLGAKLTNLGNRYWATTRYEELLEKSKVAREDARQLNRAFQLVSLGGISNLIEAIELAKAVNPTSYAYNSAQKLIKDASQRLLNMARVSLDNEDWRGIIQIANRLADVVDTQEARQLDELAQAIIKAQENNSASLNIAVNRLQRIDSSSPLFDRIQRLSNRWRREAEGLEGIERARQLASSGQISDLTAAIAQAQLIPPTSPRYREAQTLIQNWTIQMQANEDRPVLNRADQLAASGSETALQAAIQEASSIPANRPLYQEAQSRINQWSSRLQADQDRAYLDQAEAFARRGNLPEAISLASQIPQGRSLYNQAQSNIQTWQQQLNTAGEADTGYRTLALAQQRATVNLNEAIDLARTISPQSQAYSSAQAQIQDWLRLAGQR